MKKIKDIFFAHEEVIMYLIMGVATTVVNWIIYHIMMSNVHLGASLSPALKGLGINVSESTLNILIAGIVAWVGAVLFAYITNRIWVFKSTSTGKAAIFKELVLFFAARIITGIIEIVGTPLLAKTGLEQLLLSPDGPLLITVGKISSIRSFISTEGMISKIIISVIVIILNYVFSKLMVFKQEDK